MTGVIWRFLAGAVLAALVCPLAALEPSALEPSTSDRPILTLVNGDETRRLSLREIEALDLYEAEFRHFEGKEGTFTGVRLKEFLAAHGMDDARRVRFIGADDYTAFLDQEELREKERLLVTRFDGEPIPMNDLGPLMLVVPEDAEAVLAGETSMTKWVWSIVEIRAR